MKPNSLFKGKYTKKALFVIVPVILCAIIVCVLVVSLNDRSAKAEKTRESEKVADSENPGVLSNERGDEEDMDKLYERINFENAPSTKTPLNEETMNKIDAAIDNIDNRVISVSDSKLDNGVMVNTFPNSGYILTSGGSYPDTTGTWSYTNQTVIPDGASKIEFSLFQYSGVVNMLSFYTSELSYIDGVDLVSAETDKTIVSGEVTIPANAKYVRATRKNNASGNQYFRILRDGMESELMGLPERVAGLESTFLLKTSINKPQTFDGGNIICFGDSIMRGYLPDATITENSWINLFKEKANVANVKNCALGGATIASTPNSGVKTIYQQMTEGNNGGAEILNTRSHIIVSAGTNDYDKGVSKEDFVQALNDIADYINSNKGEQTEVIFITPFNRTKATTYTEAAELDWYREQITICALKNGYSIIDGTEFGIPNYECEFQTLTMSDGLHPTELGYSIIAQKMCDILL